MSSSSLGFVQAATFKAILPPKLKAVGSSRGSIINFSESVGMSLVVPGAAAISHQHQGSLSSCSLDQRVKQPQPPQYQPQHAAHGASPSFFVKKRKKKKAPKNKWGKENQTNESEVWEHWLKKKKSKQKAYANNRSAACPHKNMFSLF